MHQLILFLLTVFLALTPPTTANSKNIDTLMIDGSLFEGLPKAKNNLQTSDTSFFNKIMSLNKELDCASQSLDKVVIKTQKLRQKNEDPFKNLALLRIEDLTYSAAKLTKLLSTTAAQNVFSPDLEGWQRLSLTASIETHETSIANITYQLKRTFELAQQVFTTPQKAKQVNAICASIEEQLYLISKQTTLLKKVLNRENNAPSFFSQSATFIKTRDGDSFLVEINQVRTDTRLISVDCPEYNEPGGKTARAFSQKFLEGDGKIYLEFDEQRFDPFNRLLAYVWKNGEMLNRKLISSGLCKEKVYLPNKKYRFN